MGDRQQDVANRYDLIVIGGGINGAGVARDAALRGLKTALIEKGDVASGTTGWSTRLIHGGLRYLEYLEFGLVRESLREREILLKIAPHLVVPLQLTIPLYRNGSRSRSLIQAGMILYDLLSFDRSLPGHRMLGAAQFRQVFRSIHVDEAVGAAQYYDAQVPRAERLCWETVLAARMAGADIFSYAEAISMPLEQGAIAEIICRDAIDDGTFSLPVGPQTVVVNAGGPWVDSVCGLAKSLQTPQLMGGTKGSHIIVDAFPGAPPALYVEAKTDNRPFFIIPWLDRYLIGTTDLRYGGSLDAVKASDAEIDYLLAETNRIIPTAQLTRADVKFTYSGIRPLPAKPSGSTSSITRSHSIYDHTRDGASNLLSLVGGKLTTHRGSSAQLVAAVCHKLNRSTPPCLTASTPLPGAMLPTDAIVRDVQRQYGDRLPAATISHLFSIYGRQTERVLALTDTSPDLLEPVATTQPDIRAQVVFAEREEMARTMLDITLRRTSMAISEHYGRDVLPGIATVLQTHCGWSQDRCDRDIAKHERYVRSNCVPDYAIETAM
ncbi:MAG: glycerol-3-phosphate dehydrogenase/oxidase [Cyanobacteria bacterium P01_D01_bin.123]